MISVLLAIVEGNPPLQGRAGAGRLPKVGPVIPSTRCASRRNAGSHMLSARLTSCSPSSRAVVNAPRTTIKCPQSPQHGEKLRGVPHLLAQRARPGIGLFHFGGGLALGRHQRLTQGRLDAQLLLRPCWGLRKGAQQRQPRGEMPDRFLISMPLEGILRRLLEIRHGPCGVPAAHKVVR